MNQVKQGIEGMPVEGKYFLPAPNGTGYGIDLKLPELEYIHCFHRDNPLSLSVSAGHIQSLAFEAGSPHHVGNASEGESMIDFIHGNRGMQFPAVIRNALLVFLSLCRICAMRRPRALPNMLLGAVERRGTTQVRLADV